MRFKIIYHPSIFEKYRIFNIDEHIWIFRTKQQSTLTSVMNRILSLTLHWKRGIPSPQKPNDITRIISIKIKAFAILLLYLLDTLTSLYQYIKRTTGPILLILRGALVHVTNFGGCQGRRTGVGVTTVSNSLILGGWVTKVLKNGDKK